MDRPDILLDHERRISTLEGITSATRETLNRVCARLNMLNQLIVGNFALTLLTAIGIVITVILRL
jgi:hypothetical protein